MEWTETTFSLEDVELEKNILSREIIYNCTSVGMEFSSCILVIHGFGNDGTLSYNRQLREKISTKTKDLVVSVNYHCCNSRPHNGAIEKFTSQSINYLKLLCFKYDVEFVENNLTMVLNELDSKLDMKIELEAQLIPKNDEYQNFGLLQAIDHVFVIYDLIKKYNLKKIILFGSSHGGYIAHLITKMMPNTIMTVLDNSSYTYAPLMYLGSDYEYARHMNNISIYSNLITKWQFKYNNEITYFGPDKSLIRECANEEHISVMAQKSKYKTQYLMGNSINDCLSPISIKRYQNKLYQKYGFDTYLYEVNNENIMNNKVFKSLEHADVSLVEFFNFFFPMIKERIHRFDNVLETEIRYDCFDKVYIFSHQKSYPFFQVKITVK